MFEKGKKKNQMIDIHPIPYSAFESYKNQSFNPQKTFCFRLQRAKNKKWKQKRSMISSKNYSHPCQGSLTLMKVKTSTLHAWIYRILVNRMVDISKPYGMLNLTHNYLKSLRYFSEILGLWNYSVRGIHRKINKI